MNPFRFSAFLALCFIGLSTAFSAYGQVVQDDGQPYVIPDSQSPSQTIEVPVVRVVNQSQNQPQTVWERECRPVQEVIYGRERASTGSTLLGAIVGGALGHTIGKGDGRRAATIGGAVIGGAMASGSRPYRQVVTHEECQERPVTRWQHYDNYEVTYRFHHHLYTVNMPYDPGQTLRLRVQVSVEQ